MNPDIPLINNEISISKNEWIELNQSFDQNSIKIALTKTILDNKLPLPYRKISIQEAIDDFKLLKSLDANKLLKNKNFSIRYPCKYDLLDSYLDFCTIGNLSSDFFQQENRFNCDSINSPSPKRIWNNAKFLMSFLNSLWSLKVDHVDNTVLRSSIAVRKYIASQFKPSVAKYIYQTYGNKGSILDFSSGWGDRLAGFYSSDCLSYTGIDPNKDVFYKYNEQKTLYEQYSFGKTTNFINKPAEDVDLGNEKFDLIFTSPPYFDIERYSKDNSQSWIRYKTVDDWLNLFLFKVINNFWDNLKTNGYLIINISDVYCHHKIQKISDPINNFISKLNGSEYKGALGMRISKRPNNKINTNEILAEPLYIWQKTS